MVYTFGSYKRYILGVAKRMVYTIRGNRSCQNKQLSLYNMGSESKRWAARGCLLRRNRECNKDQDQQYEDQERQYEDKEPLIITNAQMSDRQLQYRLHISDALNPAYVGIFLAYHERLHCNKVLQCLVHDTF